MALKVDGKVSAWGCNTSGQTTVPSTLTGVKAIAMGGTHALALRNSGTMTGWGTLNADNAHVNYRQWDVPTITNVVAIAAGSYHSLALKSDGTVVGWGEPAALPPVGTTNAAAIAAGCGYSLVLHKNGTVTGYAGAPIDGSVPPSGLTGVIAITAGCSHAMALKNDGTVVAWGSPSHGVLSVPADLTNVVAIAAGNVHSVARKDDGTLVGWGSNSHGQLSFIGYNTQQSPTRTATSTRTHTRTRTATSTATPTRTTTSTRTATQTPTAVPTSTPVPTMTPVPTAVPASNTYVFTPAGFFGWTVTNAGVDLGVSPRLTLYRTQTYTFTANSSTTHPLKLRALDAAGVQYEYTAISGFPVTTSSVSFTLPADAPNLLEYVCTNHSSMTGEIVVADMP